MCSLYGRIHTDTDYVYRKVRTVVEYMYQLCVYNGRSRILTKVGDDPRFLSGKHDYKSIHTVNSNKMSIRKYNVIQYVHTHTHTHVHTHACTHARTHAHTHTNNISHPCFQCIANETRYC